MNGFFSKLFRSDSAPPDLMIGEIQHDPVANSVSAVVDGHWVWFQAEGALLSPNPEAFAAAFLLPAALVGRRIRVQGRLSKGFVKAAVLVQSFTRGWWCNRVSLPLASDTTVSAPDETCGRSSALCFSCGVDSFHSLFEFTPDVLVFVAGYDIPLSDSRVRQAAERTVMEIARESGRRAIIIRTNLRENPFFDGQNWERTHGGALVAVGHLLRGTIDRLWISASYSDGDLHPWGSHPELDPLWSTDSLSVIHRGSDFDRFGKIQKHGANPILLKYLRVCWEKPSERGNCGLCEKCIRNRICFWFSHPEGVCETLPPHAALVDDLARCARMPNMKIVTIYARYLKGRHLADPVVAAIRDYIERSERRLLQSGKA